MIGAFEEVAAVFVVAVCGWAGDCEFVFFYVCYCYFYGGYLQGFFQGVVEFVCEQAGELSGVEAFAADALEQTTVDFEGGVYVYAVYYFVLEVV